MDISALIQGVELFTTSISAIKQVIDLLPNNSQKEELLAEVNQAERQLKIAEAQIADGLGYRLCHNHFPPEIMLSTDDATWTCPNCGNKNEPFDFSFLESLNQ
jgi:hypothetical protein